MPFLHLNNNHRHSGLLAPSVVVTIFLLALAPPLYAAIYYVDATLGTDTNNGVSEATAWKTIAKVNASNFVPGDQILFKRGEVWRVQLTVPSSGAAGKPITFGAYGSRALPKILGSIDLSSSGNWAQASSFTWYATARLDIGNIIFNSEASVGVKKSSIGAMGTQGDFYWDSAGTPGDWTFSY